MTRFTSRLLVALSLSLGALGAWADPERRLSVAMVNNRLGGTPFGDMRIAAIGSSVIDSVSKIRKRRREDNGLGAADLNDEALAFSG